MGTVQLLVLIAVFVTLVSAQPGFAQKFFPDDPIQVMPPPLPVPKALNRDVNPIYDFLYNSLKPEMRPPTPAGAVNTLGEVPDSAWFINRHERHRMSREELQRGPGNDKAPVPPFTVVSGKTEGVSPGFSMRDSEGRIYFVKLDPLSNPEMATAADAIVSKFLYAIGYNTPENYILDAKLSDFRLSHKARIHTSEWQSRKMTWGDLSDMVAEHPVYPDGCFRILASLEVEGEAIGPFRFQGTRRDDPNDTVPHQNRRDLRGYSVFSAWLNHTDSKADNSLDTIVEENGVPFIRHYLIDFNSALGSDGNTPKDPRFGYEFMFPNRKDVLRIAELGLVPAPWERARFPKAPAVGNLESGLFDPDNWKSNYPNPAFLSRLPDDEFWAAKIVMAFTDDDIRAIVETGKFSDPWVVDYIAATLAKRRDKIGQTYFSKVLPLDRFRVQSGELEFEDLAASYGFRPAEEYAVRWSLFDNITQQHHVLPGGSSRRLPDQAAQAPSGTYFSAVIYSPKEERKSVTVTIRKTEHGYEVVGIERAW